jgi:hypothetical protein
MWATCERVAELQIFTRPTSDKFKGLGTCLLLNVKRSDSSFKNLSYAPCLRRATWLG